MCMCFLAHKNIIFDKITAILTLTFQTLESSIDWMCWGSWVRMGLGVRTGLGHGGITCVLQTQFSSFLLFFLTMQTKIHKFCRQHFGALRDNYFQRDYGKKFMEVHVKDNLCWICFLFLMKNIFFTLTTPAEVLWHAKRGPGQLLTHSIKGWTKREKGITIRALNLTAEGFGLNPTEGRFLSIHKQSFMEHLFHYYHSVGSEWLKYCLKCCKIIHLYLTGELTAYCMGPRQVAVCELADNHDGTFRLGIRPKESGRHVLQVKYGGEHVQGKLWAFYRHLMILHEQV